MTFYDSISLVKEEHWNSIQAGKNIYLSIPYLKSVEQSMPDKVAFHYMIFYSSDNKPQAIAAVQVLDFVDQSAKHFDALCKLGNRLKDKVMRSLDIRVMVCGNVFACGENGFMFSDDLTPEEAYENLSAGLYRLRRASQDDDNISVVLLKDFWKDSLTGTQSLEKSNFRAFEIDVNMVLPIHESWDTLDDYLSSMTSKFRTKAKSVFKKSNEVVTKELTAGEIEENKDRINHLYESVLECADFKFGELNGNSFHLFKKELGEKYLFKAYYMGDEMVAFCSGFITGGVLDASYVGLDYELNQKLGLYQKLLYDYVQMAIDNDLSELRLGRTAEEIKSCLGAEPQGMTLYMRHRNSVSNKLLKPIMQSISPSEFALRKPFKATFG